MTVNVKNIGCVQYAGGASLWKKDTIVKNTFGEVGTVRVGYEGREYVFGPNQTINFADDGIGAAVAAADARLRVVDDRDGAWVKGNYANCSGPSVVVRSY